MCDLKPHAYIKARYRKNASHGSHYADSQIVHQFKKNAWIPNMEVAFVTPAKVLLRVQLPEGFLFDSGWN